MKCSPHTALGCAGDRTAADSGGLPRGDERLRVPGGEGCPGPPPPDGIIVQQRASPPRTCCPYFKMRNQDNENEFKMILRTRNKANEPERKATIEGEGELGREGGLGEPSGV